MSDRACFLFAGVALVVAISATGVLSGVIRPALALDSSRGPWAAAVKVRFPDDADFPPRLWAACVHGRQLYLAESAAGVALAHVPGGCQ